jgi:hypothetical protein
MPPLTELLVRRMQMIRIRWSTMLHCRLLVAMALVGASQSAQFSAAIMEPLVLLRGGGGDPALVAAQVTTAASLTEGSLSFFLPKTNAEIFGIPNIELPMVEIMTTGIGSCLLSIGVMGSILFFGAEDSRRVNKAIALSYLPFTLSLIRNMCNGIYAKVHQPLSSMWFGMAVNTGLALAISMDASKYAMLAATIWSGVIVLTGLSFVANPKATVAAWGVQGSTTALDLYLMQAYGILLCHTHFIVLVGLIYGTIAPIPSYGFGALFSFVSLLSLHLWTHRRQKEN